jgi:hypothetical protein
MGSAEEKAKCRFCRIVFAVKGKAVLRAKSNLDNFAGKDSQGPGERVKGKMLGQW